MMRRKRRIRFLKVVMAIIIKPFTYRGYKGDRVHVAKNTRIVVDLALGIALVGPDHIDIAVDEYRVILPQA